MIELGELRPSVNMLKAVEGTRQMFVQVLNNTNLSLFY